MPETTRADSLPNMLPIPTLLAHNSAIVPLDEPTRLPLSLADVPDERLIALAKGGEKDAFSELVGRHLESVHRWMARAVGQQDADDLTQEVFLKAYRGLTGFRGDAPPRAWLASIADNAVKNRYRARSRFARVFAGNRGEEGPADPVGTANPEDDARAGESRRSIAEAFRAPPRGVSHTGRPAGSGGLELRGDRVVARSARGHGQIENRAGAGTAQGYPAPDPSLRKELVMTNSARHPARSPEFLSRLHDGDLSAAERVEFESHRSHCVACRSAAAEFEAALALYRSNRPGPPAPDLSARILRRLQSTSPRRSPWGVTFGVDLRWAGAFVTALLAVLIGSAVVVRRETETRRLAQESAPISVVLQRPEGAGASPRQYAPSRPRRKPVRTRRAGRLPSRASRLRKPRKPEGSRFSVSPGRRRGPGVGE